MSKLNIRIQNAIRNQLEVLKKMNNLREEQRAAEVAYSNTVGKLSVLSEIYEEENGRSLEHDLENDDTWKQQVSQLREQLAQGGNSAPAQQQTTVSEQEQSKPKTPRQSVSRSRQPAKITIDDNPPGPGADEE